MPMNAIKMRKIVRTFQNLLKSKRSASFPSREETKQKQLKKMYQFKSFSYLLNLNYLCVIYMREKTYSLPIKYGDDRKD